MDSAWAGVAVGAVVGIPGWVGVGAMWVRAGIADGQAQRAEERSEGMLEANQQMARALDRLAGSGSGETPRDIHEPPVSFIAENFGAGLYALRNLGPQTATGVTIEGAAVGKVEGRPIHVTLAPFEPYNFLLAGTFADSSPASVVVRCDELEQPVRVRAAPKFR